jgi:nitrogen regulatory protein P-II 2
VKLITAIIRPEQVNAVQRTLGELGLVQMTLTQVLGRGHERGQVMIYRGTTFREEQQQRVRLETAVEDELVELAVEAIQSSAKTGRTGDGVVLVTALEDFVRIRTGQHIARTEERAITPRVLHSPPHLMRQVLTAGSPSLQ